MSVSLGVKSVILFVSPIFWDFDVERALFNECVHQPKLYSFRHWSRLR